MIDVKKLEKSFGNHKVLKGIDEHIEKGEKSSSSDRLVRVNPPSCAA